MCADAECSAVEVVTRIADQQIRQAITEYGGSLALAKNMLARKADMARRVESCDRAAGKPLPVLDGLTNQQPGATDL
jgi:uncharacterized protein YfcZ (UPF0381/DUF406 family)